MDSSRVLLLGDDLQFDAGIALSLDRESWDAEATSLRGLLQASKSSKKNAALVKKSNQLDWNQVTLNALFSTGQFVNSIVLQVDFARIANPITMRTECDGSGGNERGHWIH